jgi:hypothetical protein
MKDRENQFLFESYMQSIEEGRKKQYKDRERKTVVDPDTGEERKESYYEMMMRLKGKGSGVRSRATRQRKEKKSNKVKLGNREFKVADKSYEERLNTAQRDVVRYVEADDSAKAKDIMEFLTKTGMDKKEAEVLLGGMIADGYLDEINIKGSEAVEPTTADYVDPTASMDTEYDEIDDRPDDDMSEYQDDDLEDY